MPTELTDSLARRVRRAAGWRSGRPHRSADPAIAGPIVHCWAPPRRSMSSRWARIACRDVVRGSSLHAPARRLERRMLQPGAAPSLPLSYIDAIGAVPIAVGQGSCGTPQPFARWYSSRRRTIRSVGNLRADRIGSRPAGVLSTPIFDDTGHCLARWRFTTGAAVRRPQLEIDFIQCASSWHRFVIQRHRDTERLRASERDSRQPFGART